MELWHHLHVLSVFFFLWFWKLRQEPTCKNMSKGYKEERRQLRTTSTRRVKAQQRGTNRGPSRRLRTEQRPHQKTVKPIWSGFPKAFNIFNPVLLLFYGKFCMLNSFSFCCCCCCSNVEFVFNTNIFQMIWLTSWLGQSPLVETDLGFSRLQNRVC